MFIPIPGADFSSFDNAGGGVLTSGQHVQFAAMTSNASTVLELAALSSAGRPSSLLGLPALLLLLTEAKCGVFANA
jgi:hypothetical protein